MKTREEFEKKYQGLIEERFNIVPKDPEIPDELLKYTFTSVLYEAYEIGFENGYAEGWDSGYDFLREDM